MQARPLSAVGVSIYHLDESNSCQPRRRGDSLGSWPLECNGFVQWTNAKFSLATDARIPAFVEPESARIKRIPILLNPGKHSKAFQNGQQNKKIYLVFIFFYNKLFIPWTDKIQWVISICRMLHLSLQVSIRYRDHGSILMATIQTQLWQVRVQRELFLVKNLRNWSKRNSVKKYHYSGRFRFKSI